MIAVQHDAAGRRFYVAIEGEEASLRYRPVGERVLDFTATFVPVSLRTRGIGGELVKAALLYARAHDYRVVSSCWFVSRYLERHPEYADLAA